jgi:uncharacterized membrane protein HdeD (DUF308 family)
VPAPGPQATPVETAAEHLRPGDSIWARRIAGLPLAAQGAVTVAAGALLLALRNPSLRTAGIVVGVAIVAFAAFELVELARHDNRANRVDRLVAVAALAGAGALLLAWPAITQRALLYAAGVSAVVFGVAETAALSTRPFSARERWLGGISSVIAFVFGIAMLARPRSSLTAAIDLLAVYLIATGGLRVVQFAEAWRRRRRAP